MATKFITPSWRMPKNSNQSKASNYSIDFDQTDKIDAALSISGDWTLSFWFNVPAYDATIQYALGFELGTGLDGGIFTDYNTYSSKWGFYRGNASYRADSALSVGNWHHCVITRTGNDLAFYADGVADGTGTNTDSMDIASFRIGERTDNNWGLTGKMASVSVFDYVLPLEAITALYNSGIPANPLAVTTPPIAYYDLGQGSAYAEGSAGIVEPNLAAATGSTVFEFDGNNGDNDEIDTKATLSQLGFPATTVSEGSFTVSFWYNANTHVNYAPVVWSSTNYNLNDGFGISQQLSTTQLRFWVGRYALNWVATSGLNTSQWYHIVAVFTGGSTYSLQTYVDGVPGSPSTGTTSYNITSSSNPLHLGSSGGAHVVSYPLDGKLSNTQVWNTNLSDSEILTLYNNGTPLQSNIPQSGSLKAWYKLGLDTSNWDGSNWEIGEAQANYSTALRFNYPSNGSGVTVPINLANALGDGVTNMSVSIWFKLDTNTGEAGIFRVGFGAPYGKFAVWKGYGNNSLVFCVGGGTNFLRYNMVTNSKPDKTWYHLLVTYDASAGSTRGDVQKMYLNGEDLNIASSAAAVSSIDLGNNQDTTQIGYFTVYKDDMQLSNFAVYNTTLTAANALTLYNGGTPQETIFGSPLSWLTLKDTSDSSGGGLFDNGSVGANGTLGTQVSKVNTLVSTLNGKSSGMDTTNLVPSNLIKSIPYSGYSMEFDNASGTYITTGLTIAADSNFSVSFWVKGGTSPGTKYPGIFPFGIGNADNGTLGRMHPSGVYKFMIQGYDNTGANFGNRIIDIDIWDGSWYHILFTRDNTSGQLFAYVNGVNVEWGSAWGSNAAPSITVNPSGDLYIGTAGGNTSYTFDGFVSNLAIFNRVLTQDEILRAYNGGSPGDLTNLNPDSWWSLGADSYFNGSDWICPDLGSNTNNGTSDSMGVGNLVGDGPDSLANGTSTNLDLASDLIGEAPGSTGNAISINMNSLARTGSTP